MTTQEPDQSVFRDCFSTALFIHGESSDFSWPFVNLVFLRNIIFSCPFHYFYRVSYLAIFPEKSIFLNRYAKKRSSLIIKFLQKFMINIINIYLFSIYLFNIYLFIFILIYIIFIYLNIYLFNIYLFIILFTIVSVIIFTIHT